MTTAFSFSGGAPPAQPGAPTSSGAAGGFRGTEAAPSAFGQAPRGFPPAIATNGGATAAPATSNPFGAAPVNPFLAKAASSAPAAAPAPAPANPFQAARKPSNPSPFAAASSQPAAPASASPFGVFGRPTPTDTGVANAPPQQPSFSPSQTAQTASGGASPNPFASLQKLATATSPFAPAPGTPSGGFSASQPTPTTTGFGQAATQPAAVSGAPTQSIPVTAATSVPSNPFLSLAKPSTTPSPSPSPFPATPLAAATPATTFGALSGGTAKPAAKKSVHFNPDPVSSQQAPPGFGKPAPTNDLGKSKPVTTALPKPPANAPTEPQSDYAKKIVAQLHKDRLKPPQWPADPGNPAHASAMETFWISYGNYRDKVRASLVKAGLIDDPKVRKRLDEAIDFKGICEEMCPEYEKIERIYQHNVMMAEKTESPDGTMWPSPPLMVKALTRSSAGQEAPLPMDVRTVAALKRTLDHLIDDVLGDDSRLPTVHNFLWDRTRAIRRDFIFHSSMSEEEMRQQIYCLETITRFHATSLHLLSQKGFAPEGFDQRQEREQLSKALLSLLQAYDDCKDRQIICSNEYEFRAYFILLNAHDPNFQHKVAEWGMELWYDSDDVQTAMTLAQAMQSVWDWRGPVKPTAPTTTALGAFATFFRIIESPQVSYTMACLAEMHFVHVRRGILRNMTRAYSRARDSPKDLTLAALNDMLRFDTLDEAWDFVIANKLEFSSEDKATAHLVLDKAVQISSMPIPQLFSQNLVERKRAGRSLPEALHGNVYEDARYATPAAAPATEKQSDMFVSQSPSPANPGSGESQIKTPSVFPVVPATSILGRATAQSTSATPSLFGTTASSAKPAASSSIFSQQSMSLEKKDAAPSLFQTTPSTTDITDKTLGKTASPVSSSIFSKPASTTPTSSPTKLSGASNLFGIKSPSAPSVFDAKAHITTTTAATPAAPIVSQTPTATTTSMPTTAASVLSQPSAGSSFSALFPAPVPPAPEAKPAVTAPPATTASSPSTNPLFAAGTTKRTSTKPESGQPILDHPKPSFSLGETSKAPANSPFSPVVSSTQTIQVATPKMVSTSRPSPPPPPPADRIGDFTKWFVLGDNGILTEFQEAYVEHLVRQTFEHFQDDEDDRLRREEDERSWAEALRFKTYNLRVKYFYKWRRIARERALDRRARQARDELKAYRAAKRAEQRAAAEKAVAEERERAAAARRMDSKEAHFLHELGYYGEFGAFSKKRKAAGALEPRARSVSLSAVETPAEPQEEPPEPQRSAKLPVRSIKEGISSTVAHTVSRAKELISSRIASHGSSKRHRASVGSIDGGSVSGDSIRSVHSMRSSFSPDGSQVAYYRRSIPGKSRAHSFFTRIPSGTAPEDTMGPPKKMTNFMRYSKTNFGFGEGSSVSGSGHDGSEKRNRWSSPGSRARPATATASPSPSSFAGSLSASVAGSGLGGTSGAGGAGAGGSKVRSSYWRLRAMGMVQMPNKQYLHESLALPMLQDGKRFPGVGSYGLPPVPAWKDGEAGGADDFRISQDGGDGGADGDVDGDDDEDGEDVQIRTRRYTEERLRRTAMPPSRKRMFSDGQDGTIGAGESSAQPRRAVATAAMAAAAAAAASAPVSALAQPPEAKKARVLANARADNSATSTLSEAENVIREMREMADAMDQGRDWFREQTELMKSGTSAWDG